MFYSPHPFLFPEFWKSGTALKGHQVTHFKDHATRVKGFLKCGKVNDGITEKLEPPGRRGAELPKMLPGLIL